MSTGRSPQTVRYISHPEEGREYVLDTRVSAFDKVSAFLVAGIAVIGLLVFVGFLIWLTLFEWQSVTQSVPIREQIGNQDRPEGVADDWQPPGVEEFPEVKKPQLADALQAMTEAASTTRAQLEEYDGNVMKMGQGPGMGDRRERGSGSGNANVVPPAERWRIQYAASSMAEYLAQLEYFNVEIGAVSRTTNRIDLISNLTQNSPNVTYTDRASEDRIYFSYQRSRLKRWDQMVARRAGIGDVQQRLIVQFYEPNVVAQLRQLEANYIEREGKSVEEVKRTFYRVRPSGSGYEYYVDRVEYRPLPNQA